MKIEDGGRPVRGLFRRAWRRVVGWWRGYLTVETIDRQGAYFCDHCAEVVAHEHRCANAMLGICAGCGTLWSELDRWGNCASDARHEILKRRFANPAERWGLRKEM
jgi:predicted Fe-S protein YdhL (DUF1289 family)